MAKKRAHLIIHGKVQGVFFRAYLRERSEQFKLTGWAKNTFDGNVEVVLEGEESAVKQVVEWCYSGPADSEVKKVAEKWEKATGEFQDFSIQY